MEDAKGSYSHEEEVKGLQVNMGNVEKNLMEEEIGMSL
jgi:hypothetical protein